MRYDEESGEFVLSSGRRLRTNCDLLSIDEPDGYVSYGYYGDYINQTFTPEERAEIADHVIAKWRAWKVWRPLMVSEPRGYEVKIRWRDDEGDIVLTGSVEGVSAIDIHNRLVVATRSCPIVFEVGLHITSLAMTTADGKGP